MTVRIAIPEPTSTDTEYNQRSLPPYLAALHSAGAIPVVIPLHERQDRVAHLLAEVEGILLPGSGHDVNPQRYGESAIAACKAEDTARNAVDELLLQDAFNLRKPILGICYGMQTLNVWRNGSLIQHLTTAIDHSPPSRPNEAHCVHLAAGSRLAQFHRESKEQILVNSSHHQAVRVAGDQLRVAAISPEDGVIEAVELDSPEQFVVGVQWHPERTYVSSEFSRSIFAAFVCAAQNWRPRRIEDSVASA